MRLYLGYNECTKLCTELGAHRLRRFAFVFHPLRVDDFARKFPLIRYFPPGLVSSAFTHVKPFKVSTIRGIQGADGSTAEGYFIAMPWTPDKILGSPYEKVLQRLQQATQLAKDLGAELCGLGAFTKIAGDRGVTLAATSPVAVTTGNSYTVFTAVEGALRGAKELGIDLEQARATVIGASGAIGRAVSLVLARSVSDMTLVGRRSAALEQVAQEVFVASGHHPRISTDPRRAVCDADIVLAVSSATETLLFPEDLKSGSVVCDVARPRNVSAKVLEMRDDVLVIDGGVIEVPGEVDFGFDFGFPPRMAEACMAETMILTLAGRIENFTIGATIDVAKVEEIGRLGQQLGFKVAGFRRFERAISMEEVASIRAKAGRRPDQAQSALA